MFTIIRDNSPMDNEHAQQLYNSTTPIRTEKIRKWLKLQTTFLPWDALPKQRLWHVVYNTKHLPTCKMCDSVVNWNSAATFANQQYNTYCSRQCSLLDPDRIAKKTATELNRYGKGRPTVVEKIKKTNNERYGTDFAIQTEECIERQKQTNIDRYGVDNYSKTENFIQQREATNTERYGVKHPSQSQICKDKTLKTISDKYGGHQGLRHIDSTIKNLYNNKDWLYEQHVTKKRTASDIADELHITVSAVLNKIRSYDIPLHYHTNTQSLLEKKLCLYLQSFNVTIIENDRTLLKRNQELDVYIPEKNVAIEFDGIYWHGESQGRDKQYHLNKTTWCLEQEIQLLHIFESDWVLKEPIIKSMIANRLGASETIIYARKCKIIELDNPTTTREFLDNNHIQGYNNSSINLGLTHNDELVSVLTLSKSRYSKKHEYEIYRFCNKLDTSVVGGASKLFAYFVKNYNPNSVITYADRRFGEGKLYEKMGFKFTHNSKPSYKYFKKGQIVLQSRIKYQKHKLSKILDEFDPNITEWQNMVANGYDRIWDCGNAVWEWHAPTLH